MTPLQHLSGHLSDYFSSNMKCSRDLANWKSFFRSDLVLLQQVLFKKRINRKLKWIFSEMCCRNYMFQKTREKFSKSVIVNTVLWKIQLGEEISHYFLLHFNLWILGVSYNKCWLSAPRYYFILRLFSKKLLVFLWS